MNVAVIINGTTPYRQKQFTEISKIKSINKINIYYTHEERVLRSWNVENFTTSKIQEYVLETRFKSKYGNLNKNLLDIVKRNDIIVITGYDQPSYILISLICKLYNKPYIVIIDGLNPQKIYKKDIGIKSLIKEKILKNSKAIFGNGEITRRYLEILNLDKKWFNQYLTVDIDKIKNICIDKNRIRSDLRKKYGIDENEFIVMYSGRIIERKNLKSVLKAINLLEKKPVFFIAGGGEEKLEQDLIDIAKKYGVKISITGFIEQQEELFKHYCIADCLILPTINEVWGLVINEGMAAGLPIIVSNEVGASIDLVKHNYNGFVINPNDYEEIAENLEILINDEIKRNRMGERSSEIIDNWKFENSKKSFEELLKSIM